MHGELRYPHKIVFKKHEGEKDYVVDQDVDGG
jgi:hypothetical protein